MSTFSTYDSTVNSFYLAFYGRPADPAGLKFWSQHLAASNGELGAITQAFATSEEAQVRFGDESVNERISEIYQQLFNRTIDADGLAYWTGVVEQGNASLADISMAILKGARDTDASLSALRQKAADDFTAQVEASGSQYSGYASIEAARILVRAVTANATEADVAQLVKSAVSFADTATKTPQVVEAIAVNTTLLALFDTTRGKGDPVALAQALADTAKAAAGDPVTLESLLRGGGMDKVLKVMPAAASLKDVVKALADGGLPAAVEVVYPTAPTAPEVTPTPTPQPEKTFIVGGLGHALSISGTATDNVIVDLTTNTILRNGHNPMGNMNDITTVFAKDYAGKVTVTGKLTEIVVALGDADTNGVNGYGLIDVKSAIFSGEPGARKFVSHEVEALFEHVNLVRLMDTLSMEERALFDNLQGFDITKLSVDVDEQAPAQPVISLAEDNGASPNDGVTSVAKLLITGLDNDSGTTWQYSIDNGVTWTDGGENNDSGKAELDLSKMQAEGTTLQVRQLDAAGNAGPASKAVTFTIVPDLEEPSSPPTPPSDTDQPPSIPPAEPETPPVPQTDLYHRATYQFASGQDKMTLISSTGSVTGVTDPAKLEMSNYASNNWLPVEGQYLTNGFSMSGNTMQFGAELNAGLYLLRWKAETFTTTNGFLSNGMQLFAGGSAGAFTHDGTSIARIEYATGDTIRDASYGLNDAIIATSIGATHIVPGKASNVVVDSGTLTIGFNDFALAGGSLILGFDAGSDKIAIEGTAAAALDRGNKGTIDWSIAGAGRVTVGAMDEGVAVMLDLGDTIAVGSKAALAQSADVLNKYIDVGLAEQDLLIYVVEPDNTSSSALFHYSDLDGNSRIDAAELTYLAMFNGGIADLDDVIVVGTQQPV